MPYIEKNGPLSSNSMPGNIGKPSENSSFSGLQNKSVLKSAFSILTEKREVSNASKNESVNSKVNEKKSEGLFDGKRITKNEFIHELESDRGKVHLSKEEVKNLVEGLPHEYYGKVGERDVKKEIKHLHAEKNSAGSHEEKSFFGREEDLLKKQLEKK